MSIGHNIPDPSISGTGPLMGHERRETGRADQAGAATEMPVTGTGAKRGVSELKALFGGGAASASASAGKGVAKAAGNLSSVGQAPKKAISGAGTVVLPGITARTGQPQKAQPPKPPTQTAETPSTPSVKDIAKMFDDIELPSVTGHSPRPQPPLQQKQTPPPQPEFQDIGLDIDAEIEQLNTMIEAKEGTPHEGYLINPSLIQDLDTSAQKQESSKATADPTKGKEEASSDTPLTDSQIKTLQETLKSAGVEMDDEVDTSPSPLPPPSADSSSTPGKMEEVPVTRSGAERVSIQGGEDTKPLSVQDLQAKVDALKNCKSDHQQLVLLAGLKPGERKQLTQFINGELARVGLEVQTARASRKDDLTQEKMGLLTLAAKVTMHTAELTPSTSYFGTNFSPPGVSVKTFVNTYAAHMSTNELLMGMKQALSGTPEDQKMVVKVLKEWVQSGIHLSALKDSATNNALTSLLEQMEKHESDSIKKAAAEIRHDLKEKLSNSRTTARAVLDPAVENRIAAGKGDAKAVSLVADQFRATCLQLLREVDVSEFFKGELDKSHKSPTWSAFAKNIQDLQTNLDAKISNAQTDAEKRNIANFYARVGKQCLDNGDFASSSVILFALMKYDKLLDQQGSEANKSMMAVLASPVKTAAAMNSFGPGAIPPPSRLSGLIVSLGENPTKLADERLNTDKLVTLEKILRPVFEAHQG